MTLGYTLRVATAEESESRILSSCYILHGVQTWRLRNFISFQICEKTFVDIAVLMKKRKGQPKPACEKKCVGFPARLYLLRRCVQIFGH